MDQCKHTQQKSTCMRHSCFIYFTASSSSSSLFFLFFSYSFLCVKENRLWNQVGWYNNNVHTIFVRLDEWCVPQASLFSTSQAQHTLVFLLKKLNEWRVCVCAFFRVLFFSGVRFFLFVLCSFIKQYDSVLYHSFPIPNQMFACCGQLDCEHETHQLSIVH